MGHKEDCRRYRERNPNVDKIYYETHKEEILAKQNTPEKKAQRKEYNRIYRLKNREKILSLQKRYREINREILLGKSKEYSIENREEINKKIKIRRDKNRDKMRSYYTKYNGDYYKKNKEKLKLQAKEYRDSHKVESARTQKTWRENNRERKAATDKHWRDNNPDKELANKKKYYEKYFLLSKESYPHIKDAFEFRFALLAWSKSVKKRDSYKCLSCGLKDKLHAHHIIPKSIDPSKVLDIDNGKTLCKSCHVLEHRRMKETQ